MQHRIDWSRPATLIRSEHIAQFGDGYRQVTGPTIAEGNVEELLEQMRAMSASEAAKTYICNEGGTPLSLAEAERQSKERNQDRSV